MSSKYARHLQRAADLIGKYQRTQMFGGGNDDVIPHVHKRRSDRPDGPDGPEGSKKAKTQHRLNKMNIAQMFVNWISNEENQHDGAIEADWQKFFLLNPDVNDGGIIPYGDKRLDRPEGPKKAKTQHRLNKMNIAQRFADWISNEENQHDGAIEADWQRFFLMNPDTF